MARKTQSSSFDPAVFLTTVDQGRSKSEYRAGQVIFSQGEAADSVFCIVRGKIKIAVTSGQGREAVIGIFGDRDFFGEGCLIAQPVRLATATAMTDVTVEPALPGVFTIHLLTRNHRVDADLVDHLFNSSERRLARVLLLLANFGKEGKPEPITTKISQETLADMIGTTRPRVSFFMNKFRRLGFIEHNGNLKVHSSLLSVLLRE
jgi:CRP-like cAMP-binding protein